MSSAINFHRKFEPEKFYHVIAKAVDDIKLFANNENKSFFLKRLAVYIPTFTDVYAYCLLDNHLHCLIKQKPLNETENTLLKRKKVHERFGGRQYFIQTHKMQSEIYYSHNLEGE